MASALIATAGALGGCGTAPESAAPVLAEGLVPASGTTPIDASSDPAASSAMAAPSAEVVPIDWTRAPDCPTVLGWLDAAAKAQRLGPDEQVPLAILLPDATTGDGWLEPASLEVAADLPIGLIDGNAGGDGLDVPCVIQVGRPRGQRSARRVIAQDQVRSTYESGVRSERNPDYDLARDRVRRLERDLRGDGLDMVRVGDPLLDLVGRMIGGVIEGFDRGRREGELNEALAELAATPRSRDRPVYRAYHFDRVVVQAAKEAVVPVALHDRTTGAVRSALLRQRERRQFFILDGLDPRDKDYRQWRQASIDEPGLRRWLEAPPRLASTAVVAALLDAPASDRDAGILVAAPPGTGRAPQALSPRSIEIAAATRPRSRPQTRRRAEAAWRGDDGAFDRAYRDGGDDDQDDPWWEDDSWQETDPRDGDDRAEAVDVWDRGPVDPSPDEGAFPPDETLLVDLSRPVGTAPEPTGVVSRSMVRIVVGARAGSGFYVARDRVLTTARLVAGANVVEVIGADGVNVLGVVARTDPVRDLALVHMPRPGQPVDLAPPGDAGPGALAVGRQGDAGLVPVTVGLASPAAEPGGADAPVAGRPPIPVSAAAVLAFIKGEPTVGRSPR